MKASTRFRDFQSYRGDRYESGVALFCTEALIVRRGGRALFRPLDLTVDAGARWVVSGPSGSGKTSLLRALCRLDPCEGRLTLRDVAAEMIAPPLWRAKVTWVSAETALAPGAIEASLEAPFRFAAVRVPYDSARVRQRLEAVGLGGLDLSRSTEALSAGQRQRVALVRGLGIEPDVLLADEPTAHLDPDTRDQVVAVLREFASKGRAVLVVTHDPAVVEGLEATVLSLEAAR